MKIFRKVPSLKFLVEVNEDGVVRNSKSKREYTHSISSGGYHTVHISNKKHTFDKTVYVHALVMECWGPPQPTPEHTVDHQDRNLNNNSIHNLRWATKQEQTANRQLSSDLPERKRAQAKSWVDNAHLVVAHTKQKQPCLLRKGSEIHIFDSIKECKLWLNVIGLSTDQKQGRHTCKGYTFEYLERSNDYPVRE